MKILRIEIFTIMMASVLLTNIGEAKASASMGALPTKKKTTINKKDRVETQNMIRAMARPQTKFETTAARKPTNTSHKYRAHVGPDGGDMAWSYLGGADPNHLAKADQIDMMEMDLQAMEDADYRGVTRVRKDRARFSKEDPKIKSDQ